MQASIATSQSKTGSQCLRFDSGGGGGGLCLTLPQEHRQGATAVPVDRLIHDVLETKISSRTTRGVLYCIDNVILLVRRQATDQKICARCGNARPTIVVQLVEEDPRRPGAAVVLFKELAPKIKGKYCLWLQCALSPVEREVAKAMDMTPREYSLSSFDWCLNETGDE